MSRRVVSTAARASAWRGIAARQHPRSRRRGARQPGSDLVSSTARRRSLRRRSRSRNVIGLRFERAGLGKIDIRCRMDEHELGAVGGRDPQGDRQGAFRSRRAVERRQHPRYRIGGASPISSAGIVCSCRVVCSNGSPASAINPDHSEEALRGPD
jgi:hypothetical protein